MKIIVTILCLIIPAVASAQNQGPDMQKLGQAMQEMMQCMAQINQAELATLQEKSELFEQELEQLCREGKRDKAQNKAIAFSKEMKKNPALQQMEKCGEINKKYGIAQDEDEESSPFFGDDLESSNYNVCDDFEEG